MPIHLFDTETPLEPLRERIRDRIVEVVDRGVYILGPEVRAFEDEFAAYLGARHVIGVGNGTDAITIGLRALGVRSGDEVVVPSFTFYASAEAIVNAGARPVFCDVDPDTRNVTADTVRAALTPATTAVVAVDLFGCPAPIAEIRELGLPVLEDAAQAAGAEPGRPPAPVPWPTPATFSFYPSKNLGAFGDGGAIVTDDDEVADLARVAALPRLPRQADVRVRGLQLASGRAAGGRPASPAPGARRLVRRPACARRRRTPRRGSSEYVTPPAVPEGAEPGLASVRGDASGCR